MTSVIPNQKKLLRLALKAKEYGCRETSSFPPSEKCYQNVRYIMHRLICQKNTKLKINMVLAKKISKILKTNIPLLLEKKVKEKIQNFQNISGSSKIDA